MAIFIQDIRLIGTAYLQAASVEEAEQRLAELYPVCMDVNDRAWYRSCDGIFVSSGFTIDTLVAGQLPMPVTRRAMTEAMRSSVRGEKAFWLPARDLRRSSNELDLFAIDISLIATAFIEAGDVVSARELYEGFNGQTIDADNATCFEVCGLVDEEWLIAFSPMVSIVGPQEYAKIHLEAKGCSDFACIDADPVAQLGWAAITACGASSYAKDGSIEIAADRLKKTFGEWGTPFSDITNEAASEIALLMRDVLDRRGLDRETDTIPRTPVMPVEAQPDCAD
jgi:hypothetical protein